MSCQLEVSVERINEFFAQCGFNTRIAKINHHQCEVQPGVWGWWVLNESQSENITDCARRHMPEMPKEYNNALLLDSLERRKQETVGTFVTASVCVSP